MITLAGYEIEAMLHESSNSRVYRGHRLDDHTPVVLKVLQGEYPTPERIARFKAEYQLMRGIDLPGVVRPYSFEEEQHSWIMVEEDFGGGALNQIELAGTISTLQFLQLALQITATLAQLHQQQIIHKDINPANLIFNQATGQIKLTDFGIATRLSREVRSLGGADMMEGTILYMAPEQTGRMNRAVDERSDFYALGVTFYELLAGQPPFSGSDTLELVHAHLAKTPPPLPPHVPQPLAEIIFKLLSKNPDERYQSAEGLHADLQLCLRHWQASGSIPAVQLGQHDRSDRLHLPQRLYGRTREQALLLETFGRVAQGGCELLLVGGYPGIGKSVLVQELSAPITQQRGLFLTGKFEQLQRHQPYMAFLQAFHGLVRQLLTRSEEQLQQWRADLLMALHSNGQVLIDVIPELELVLGPQPPVPTLGAAESQNRLHLVMQQLFQACASAEHPLVLFLDDLQWADSASLQLLHALLTGTEQPYLLVIGAYRDTEMPAGHQLLRTAQELERRGQTVHTLALRPLAVEDVAQWLGDALRAPQQQMLPLAELLVAKTEGNPFFLTEFLKALVAERLLSFDRAQGSWTWSVPAIHARGMTDNVIELLTKKLQALQERTQELLMLAACIGIQFELTTLAHVTQRSQQELAGVLWEAVRHGIIEPLGESYRLIEQDIAGLEEAVQVAYRFAHDRLQQAAYELIAAADRPALHERIGRVLLEHTPPSEREQQIFKMMSQLNRALHLIHDQRERDHYAELNLLAGQRAKRASAFEVAYEYLEHGITLVGEEGWQRRYELTLALSEEGAEAAMLAGQQERMEQLISEVRTHATSLLERMKVIEVKLQALAIQGKFAEAVQIALATLRELGISIPDQPTPEQTGADLMHCRAMLAQRPIAELRTLPPMTDPVSLVAMRLMVKALGSTYMGAPAYFPFLAMAMLRLSLTEGNSQYAGAAYSTFGIFLATVFDDVETAYELGMLAADLVATPEGATLRATVHSAVCSTIRLRKELLRDCIPMLMEGYQAGRDTGDFEAAGFCLVGVHGYAYFSGSELETIAANMEQSIPLLGQMKQTAAQTAMRINWQAILHLQRLHPAEELFHGPHYDKRVMLPLHQEAGDQLSINTLLIEMLMLSYFFHNYEQAAEISRTAEPYAAVRLGSHQNIRFIFYDSLTRLARYNDADAAEQQATLQRVTQHLQEIKHWADTAPMNVLQKWHLLEAERCRVRQKPYRAAEHYEQAIALAHQHGFANDHALACELAGRFYLERDKQQLAHFYLREAHYGYVRWGALAKAQHLEQLYPTLFSTAQRATTTRSKTTTPGTRRHTSQSTTATLDFGSLLKAAQAIAGEIRIERLLQSLMRLLLENAGAQRGALLLDHGGQWAIAAQGQSEPEQVQVLEFAPLTAANGEPVLPKSLIHYVARTKEPIVLSDAAAETQFSRSVYIQRHRPRSVLCMPLLNQGQLAGLLYLENNLTTAAFTAERLAVLEVLSTQAAIAIDNARLYAQLEEYNRTLEQRVEQRTAELQESNARLEGMLKLARFLQHELRGYVVGLEAVVPVVTRYLSADDTPPAAERDQLIAGIETTVGQMNHLTRQLLVLTREGVLPLQQRQPVTLSALLQPMRQQAQALATYQDLDLELEIEVPPELRVWGDPLYLALGMFTALRNAIEAMAESPVPPEPARIAVRAEAAHGSVQLRIEDNGPGFPAALLAIIAEDGQRELLGWSSKSGGSGLGLSLMQRVARLHEGVLELGNQPDGGAWVEFTLAVPPAG